MSQQATTAKRDGFSSRFGLIAAAAGSAVGLGNIWKFPYIVGENGGSAFILVYFVRMVRPSPSLSTTITLPAWTSPPRIYLAAIVSTFF